MARRPGLVARAAQGERELRLAGETRPAGMVDGIVALGEQAGDARRIEPVDGDQFAEEAVGGDGEAAVAQRHRHAAQSVGKFEMVALQLRQQVGIGLDRLADASEPMQQQRRHRLRMLVGGDRLGVAEIAERGLVVAERRRAEAHLVAQRDVSGVELGGDPVVFERRAGLRGCAGRTAPAARAPRPISASARRGRAATAARPIGRARSPAADPRRASPSRFLRLRRHDARCRNMAARASSS